MPRYTPDFNTVSANFVMLEKGEYEFQVGEPKAFERTNQEGKVSHGVRFMLTVAEGAAKGGRTMFTCYPGSDGGMSFSKQFLIAVLGYAQDSSGEKQFNEATAGEDWGYDTETGACGDMWRRALGKRVRAIVDIKIGENGQQQQNWVRFLPVAA